MPVTIDAAKADVTMGEMCDAFRETWGIWPESAGLLTVQRSGVVRYPRTL